jgi:hypothetical protein
VLCRLDCLSYIAGSFRTVGFISSSLCAKGTVILQSPTISSATPRWRVLIGPTCPSLYHGSSSQRSELCTPAARSLASRGVAWRYRSSGCESRVCHGQSFTGVPILRRRETLLKSVYTHHIHNSLDTSVAPLSSSLLHNLHRCFAPAPNNAKSITPPSPPSFPSLYRPFLSGTPPSTTKNFNQNMPSSPCILLGTPVRRCSSHS